MDKLFNSPAESVALKIEEAKTKSTMPFLKMIILGILAGAFIGLGAACSSTAAYGISDTGLARLVTGCVFPVGLMMIIVCGGELFTGNCLMGIALLDKKIKLTGMLRNLGVVWISNFIGAALIALLVNFSGNLDYSDGALGAYTIKIAVTKSSISFGTAIVSGILCNMLVCLAVLASGAAKTISGKILAVFFPICAFVTAGFEHVVANMYYIPAGIFASLNSDYLEKAVELYGYTQEQLDALSVSGLLSNIIPVTIGNIIGGGIFIGVSYYLAYVRKGKEK